ncbi:protein translocase subunit secE/sec61 gamma [Methanothermus fervidus DSM 2088]|uniref:Protein translocase subunit SecE n=1 Tax=Methanothermus fervidus (strain ATCC 43054 / DSM 2088 / JCM 10308 / V24 S) TaxID=523846 RepID=E3GXB2_METFV|nr:protein translocase SEC61 complex subunit gamma [Methanothermus fervidus]ADP76944.1 protein translocase subunit secE/sec61 gamma [Methanothermus fervidus DSM 2088]
MNIKEVVLKFTKDAKRVLYVSRKPRKEEYLSVAKVTGLGIIIIGVIGFIINMIVALMGG